SRIIHDDQSDRGLGKVTIATALARSSDVAAVKLALRLGPDSFYKYIRAFGFGSRTGIALPGETRGLLRPPSRWGSSSIGSLAIGQEVAVTPLQLVSMVSTIANGGVYLPPHILLPGQEDNHDHPLGPPPAANALRPAPFRPGSDLPNPLPPGAHRVISTLTAAEMREMLEGVVLYGTGKEAQLDGYSSAGKTGTAQKIDPTTHTYSKTMHIASFAGFAPVNNPAIAVAVVIDSPQGAYYGAAVSAPVFTEVAQQVLEYLGVPHDIDLRPPSAAAKAEAPITEDDSGESSEDIQALYEAANDLPSDDPLSATAQQAGSGNAATAQKANTPDSAAGGKTGEGGTQRNSAPSGAAPAKAAGVPPAAAVTISEAKQLRVPSLIGLSMRQAIEQAGAADLEVQIAGTGVVREQIPASGTMVNPGTKIVVRCER
ncbi:MAG: transpeptidase family protein, partial [Acidobacteriota bacterium]|nr:transpeptidase family protein [Acidobacteriota bacterium]